MSPSLLVEQLAAARAIDRHLDAAAHLRRRVARNSQLSRSGPGWRARVGWRLVEAGLRLTAADPHPVRRSGCG